MDVAVTARNLGKTYKIYDRPADRLIEAVTRKARHRDFPSLAGVSFDLPRGASLGLIGENGAGKSTLLKIVAGTTTPTDGTIATSGTVASILELGMGFHPEFSGEENARINAALLGLSSAEIKRRLPAIREFSELGDFFGRPVKTYSSGMALRLAFSVATHVDAEVLIIDEALAVGDGYFQKKSIDRILEFKKRGGTLLFCSHAMYYIAMICDEAMWLDHGRPRELGPAVPVIAKYESFLEQKERRAASPVADSPATSGRVPARITEVLVHDGSGFPRSEFAEGETVAVDVAFTTTEPSLSFHVRVGIDREDGVQIFGCDTSGWERAPLSGSDRFRIRLTIPNLPISHGNFNVSAFVADEKALYPHDFRRVAPGFSIHASRYVVGILSTPSAWSLEESSAAESEAKESAAGRR
ncbi:MAG: ABC transporter ATP-binding protein [Thermoanaerobaculia bacterium]